MIAGIIIFNGKIIGEGVIKGISCCKNVLIPAIFPFIIFADWIGASSFGEKLSLPFGFICKYIYNIPKSLAPVVIAGLIGGYPAGAIAAAEFYKRKLIDEKTFADLITFMAVISPSFAAAGIGEGLFGSRKTGLYLYFINIAVSVFIRYTFCGKITSVGYSTRQSMGFSDSVIYAVNKGSGQMLYIAALTVISFGITEFIGNTAVFKSIGSTDFILSGEAVKALLLGSVEVTGGISRLTELCYKERLITASFLGSFGGLAVILQLISSGNSKISLLRLLSARFVMGILTSALMVIFFGDSGNAVTAAALEGIRLYRTDANPYISLFLITGMVIMLFARISGEGETGGGKF